MMLAEFYTFWGLVLSWACAFVLISLATKFLRSFEDINGSRLSFLITLPFYLTMCLIAAIAVLIIWLVKRSIPKIKKNRIGVLFGPAYIEEIRNELNDLSTRLKKEIEAKDFTQIITVKTLPPNIKVGEHFKNLAVLTKANASVLISGNFEAFTVNRKNVTGFSSLTVSARTLPVAPGEASIVLGDAIFGRQLGWTSENTLHKNIVIDNLSEIARYIVGLSLIAHFRYAEAQEILGPLLLEIRQKYSSKRLPIEIVRFTNTIRAAYITSMIKHVVKEYQSALLDENLFALDKSVVHAWNNTLNQSLALFNNNPDALLMQAIIRFLLGDTGGAKDSVRRARQFVSVANQNLCDISESFLFCYEGQLRDARKLYKQLAHHPPSSETMNGVFGFLSQSIEAFADKPQIRFVYALLNDEYGDRTIALQEFRRFVSDTKDNTFYTQWIERPSFE